MTHKVCAVTGSRAEYGLLRPLLFKLRDDNEISLRLTVTGSHLSGAFGFTQNEIEEDGFNIGARIAIPMEGDGKADMARSAGYALSAFSDCFERIRPDLIVVLGDRYEIFAAAAAAAILGKTVAHISGGDVTEGSLDEYFRHCITKLSHLHFAGCESSARRIVQLGEDPKRVFNVGELGVENCLAVPKMSAEELRAHLGTDMLEKPYAIVTFHAATTEKNPVKIQIGELVKALERFPDMGFVITKANADAGGRAINAVWEAEAEHHRNWLLIPSLGNRLYISAMANSKMVIGNSSSGIIEAPTLNIPTVNIGGRQKGRMMADSVISCAPAAADIENAIKRALSPDFKETLANAISPYGGGQTSQRIYQEIKTFLAGAHEPEKIFHDIEAAR